MTEDRALNRHDFDGSRRGLAQARVYVRSAFTVVGIAGTAWVMIATAINELSGLPFGFGVSSVSLRNEAVWIITIVLTAASALRLRGRSQAIALASLGLSQAIGGLFTAPFDVLNAYLMWAGVSLLIAAGIAALDDPRPWLSGLLALGAGVAVFLMLLIVDVWLSGPYTVEIY